jgi:hypothetical protein
VLKCAEIKDENKSLDKTVCETGMWLD